MRDDTVRKLCLRRGHLAVSQRSRRHAAQQFEVFEPGDGSDMLVQLRDGDGSAEGQANALALGGHQLHRDRGALGGVLCKKKIGIKKNANS